MWLTLAVLALLLWWLAPARPITLTVYIVIGLTGMSFGSSALVHLRKPVGGPLVIALGNASGEGLLVGMIIAAATQWNSVFPVFLGLSICLFVWIAATKVESEPALQLPVSLVRGAFATISAIALESPLIASFTLLAASVVGWSIMRSTRTLGEQGVSATSRTPRSSESQNHMLSTLAHEIRTPLTIMQTTENILLEQIPGPLNERQRKFLESIYINTQRLIHFSENMLASIKLERGWVPDLSSTIDLRLVTKQVVDIMQPLLNQRRQQIRYTFPALLARPKADEPWIRQVMVNLVHNACKHTSDGGLIIISVTQDDEQVVVTVTDNGKGLIGVGREELFREFFQEQPNSTSGQDGFGLGLTIVRSVIESHGGKVYIGSSPNLGTMVSFTLPAEAPV
jgi:signal transduction histidine kinase